MSETVQTRLAHVVGSNMYVILDKHMEAVLGMCEGISEAQKLALDIESRNQGFDFETIWREYPRKIGKKSGISWLKTHIKSRSRYERLIEAVTNYKNFTIQQGTSEQFILHFSTWVRRFEDWTFENMPELKAPKPVTRPISNFDIENMLGSHGI